MSRAALPRNSKIEGPRFARSPGLSGVAGSLGLPAPRVREKRGECTEPAPFVFDDYTVHCGLRRDAAGALPAARGVRRYASGPGSAGL